MRRRTVADGGAPLTNAARAVPRTQAARSACPELVEPRSVVVLERACSRLTEVVRARCEDQTAVA
jgi:hypothetical protein